MRRRKPITRNGRPIKKLDWEIVDKKLRADCHGTTIAAIFDMHPQTFYNKVIEEKKMSFTEYSAQKKLEGDDDLKETQYDVAKVDKNTTMLIWLGKQRLGQKESVHDEEAPKKEDLDIKNQLYAALYKLQQIEKELSDLKPKTSQELPGSNTQV